MAMQVLDQNTIDEIKLRRIKTYDPSEIYLLEPLREDDVDIDIMVIVDKAEPERYDLMSKGHKALIGIKIPKNILVYTKDEFEDYSQDKSALSYLIKQHGKRIYAKA